MTLGGSKLAPQPSGRCWTASSSTDMDPYIDPYAQGRARFIRPCILPHTRMSHLQLAPGAASWWEMAGESAMDNGLIRLVEPTMTPAPGLRGERRWKSPVYTLPGLHESEHRHDPSMINPSVLLEGKDDPPMVPFPEPVWPGIWKKPSPPRNV